MQCWTSAQTTWFGRNYGLLYFGGSACWVSTRRWRTSNLVGVFARCIEDIWREWCQIWLLKWPFWMPKSVSNSYRSIYLHFNFISYIFSCLQSAGKLASIAASQAGFAGKPSYFAPISLLTTFSRMDRKPDQLQQIFPWHSNISAL